MMLRSLTLALLVVFVQTPSTRPSRDWKQASAADLELVGNAREGDLRRALREVTAFRSTLQILMPGIQLSSPVPTTLIVFRDHPSFTEFAPRNQRGRRQLNVGGYFSSADDRNYLVLPVYTDRRATYETVFHEYTHYVVSRNFREVPLWLNEGLAEFYSTFEVDSQGRAIVGKAPASSLWTLRSDRMPPLRKLLTGETAPRVFQSPDTAMFYAQSWLFVHYMTLANGGRRQGQIVKYLELLPQTKSAEAAAREAFGTTLEALERDIIRYSEGFTHPAIRITGAEFETPAVDLSPLAEAEVAALKGRLLVELGVAGEAGKYVTRALELDPTHAGARITLGRLHLAQGRPMESISELEKVAAQEPQNFSAQLYLGSALYHQARYDEAVAAHSRALKINPKAVSPWFRLSLVTMAQGQYEQSDSAMAQVQALHSAPTWHYVRAQEALKKGRYDAALADARAYIERAGAGDDSAPYAAFIGVIAARRLDKASEADAVLARITPALPPKSWPLTVAQFMRGSVDAETFLDRARDDGQRTEARTYIAFHLLQAGRKAEARVHLEWVVEKGHRSYTEYEMAVAELERLAKEQNQSEVLLTY